MSTVAAGAAGAAGAGTDKNAAGATGAGGTASGATGAGGDNKDAGGGAGGDKGQGGSFLVGGGAGAEKKKEGEAGHGQADGAAKATGAGGAGEFKLTIPEGLKADDPLVAGYTGIAKELGISGEHASKLLAWYAGEQAKTATAQQEQWTSADKKWAGQLHADKDIGGAQFDTSMALARRTLVRFGGEELGAELQRFGLGNHPGLARFLVSVGKALSEDTSKVPAAKGGKDAVSERERKQMGIYAPPEK